MSCPHAARCHAPRWGRLSLPDPSRRITVEPIRTPAPPLPSPRPPAPPRPAPPVRDPEREPLPAR